MNCPYCGSAESKVVDSRTVNRESSVRRRRECLSCQERFTTYEYVLREMTHSGGGFFSAQDADSEGEEGKFYVWTPAEIGEVLDSEAAETFCYVVEVGAALVGRPNINRLETEPCDSLTCLLNRKSHEMNRRCGQPHLPLLAGSGPSRPCGKWRGRNYRCSTNGRSLEEIAPIQVLVHYLLLNPYKTNSSLKSFTLLINTTFHMEQNQKKN